MIPISPDAQVALLNHIMRDLIKPALPPGMGATLLLFPVSPVPNPGDTSLVSYISSGRREDMRETMRGLLSRWDDYEIEKRQRK